MRTSPPFRDRAAAYAPASVGNAAVGFDILGFCLDVTGDVAVVEKIEERRVLVRSIEGVTGSLPADPLQNTAAAGLVALLEDRGLAHGFAVSLRKGIALGSGMGGSAASAVASIVAAGALLDQPLSQDDALTYALIGESVATGAFHADNVVPSLLGGLALARVGKRGTPSRPRVDVASIPIPDGVWCALVRPRVSLATRASRGALKADVPLQGHVRQSGLLAGFLIGCHQNNFELIADSLADELVEPQRARLIPGFLEAKQAALEAGALGCSIAGAGPSAFAWARGEDAARAAEDAMAGAFARSGVECDRWSTALPGAGARLLP